MERPRSKLREALRLDRRRRERAPSRGVPALPCSWPERTPRRRPASSGTRVRDGHRPAREEGGPAREDACRDGEARDELDDAADPELRPDRRLEFAHHAEELLERRGRRTGVPRQTRSRTYAASVFGSRRRSSIGDLPRRRLSSRAPGACRPRFAAPVCLIYGGRRVPDHGARAVRVSGPRAPRSGAPSPRRPSSAPSRRPGRGRGRSSGAWTRGCPIPAGPRGSRRRGPPRGARGRG